MQTLTSSKKFLLPINSPFPTHQAAGTCLQTRIDRGQFIDNEFARDLAYKANNAHPISADQAYWLHKLALEGPRKSAPTTNVGLGGAKPVIDMLNRAAGALKKPSVVLHNNGKDIKISIAGGRSKFAGDIIVADPKFGHGFYGRIDRDGDFHPTNQAWEGLTDLLIEFAEDPAAVAAKHGKLTGKCCFCNRELTDAKSTAVGYGPVCADHFGLPWGTANSPNGIGSPTVAASPGGGAITATDLIAKYGEENEHPEHQRIDHKMLKADKLVATSMSYWHWVADVMNFHGEEL